MSGDNLPRAVKIIEEVFLEHLFRLAHTQIARLKGRLRSLIDHDWLSGWPTGLKCLETDWMESAELLLQKTPRITRPAPGTGSAPGEDFFRDRLDLSRAGRFIEVISALGQLFEDLSANPARLSERLWQHGQIRQIQDITLGVMIWTAAAQSHIGGSWEVEPLRVGKWSEQFGFLGPEVMEDSIRSRVKRITPDEHQQDLVEAYLNPLFQEYAREMLPFSPGNPPDPRLVKYFMFEEQ